MIYTFFFKGRKTLYTQKIIGSTVELKIIMYLNHVIIYSIKINIIFNRKNVSLNAINIYSNQINNNLQPARQINNYSGCRDRMKPAVSGICQEICTQIFRKFE